MKLKSPKVCIHKSEYTFYEDALYQRIVDKGINVWYVTYKSKKPYWKSLSPIESRTFSRRILSDGIEIPYSKGSEKLSLSFLGMLLREGFAIVVLPLGSLVTILYLIVARLAGSVTVCHLTVHTLPKTFVGFLRSVITRISLILSDYAITLTVMHKETLLRMGFPDERIFIIPHGVDTQLFASNVPDKYLSEKLNLHGEKVILYIGRLVKEKGLCYLIQAMKLVTEKNNDVCLLIVGEGPLSKALQKVAPKLDGHVKLVGAVPSNEAPRFFSICDIHVAPSIFTKHFAEPFGMVYLEAMASGKPTIAFDIPTPVQDIIVDGETGYLVPEKDVGALAERICELLMDCRKKIRMGEKARRRAIENYDVNKIANKWADLLKHFVEREGHS